jgi:asparagine synthase (glutamine-hydrolysing)
MCGIAGLVNRKNNPCEKDVLQRMTDAVAHRGPDGEGQYFWRSVGLGHRRLAIIDLTECGHQPMAYGNEALVIVFNGEVYNYRELREELEQSGSCFRSQSDTEVILASYSAWGPDCVTRFNGMWAFAILDKKRNQIFCSRDRFGIKPFHYTETPDYFAFGSEIRQLLPFCHRRRASTGLITDFLLTSICDHTSETFFERIKKLPASHNLFYDLDSQKFTVSRYYNIQHRGELANAGPDEAVAAFGSVLNSAVDLRLRSDVPVGTCLSGGLDSSSVASLASAQYQIDSGRSFAAITAVSEQTSNDESAFASMVATSGGMEWYTVKPTYRDFLDALPSVVKAQEEPFGGPSIIMQYFVMKTARSHEIPVLLDGQGGDETLLGYTKYYASYLLTILREQGVAAFLRARALAGRNNAGMSWLNSAKYLLASLSAPLRHGFYAWRQRYLESIPSVPRHLVDFSRASWDCFALQVLEISSTNLPALLRYEDRNSMAHSIEARLPFLDYRAVETALSLPGNVKIRDGWSKWVLREFMKGRMPNAVTWRKDKLGFEAPEKIWLDRHLEAMRKKVLASPLLASLSERHRLKKVWNSLDRRSRWRLYSVALWEEAFDIAS